MKDRKRENERILAIGIETIGSNEAFIDAEVIWLLNRLFDKLGFKNLKLFINSIGCIKCRNEYIAVLIKYLFPKKNKLCPDCQYRLEKNPLRIFDCKIDQCGQVIKEFTKNLFPYIAPNAGNILTRL